MQTDLNSIPPLSALGVSEPCQVGPPSHLLEDMRFDGFSSSHSQRLKQVTGFGMNSRSASDPSKPLKESYPAEFPPQQDSPQGPEEMLFSNLTGVDTNEFARLPGLGIEVGTSFLHVGDDSPGEFNLVDGLERFASNGPLSSCGSTHGSLPHLGPFGLEEK